MPGSQLDGTDVVAALLHHHRSVDLFTTVAPIDIWPAQPKHKLELGQAVEPLPAQRQLVGRYWSEASKVSSMMAARMTDLEGCAFELTARLASGCVKTAFLQSDYQTSAGRCSGLGELGGRESQESPGR